MRILATAALALGLFAAVPARADTAQCTLTEILATNEKKGVDPRLDKLKAKLATPQFKSWDTFKLLGEQQVGAERQKPTTAKLSYGTLTLLFKDKMNAEAGHARLRFGVDIDDKDGKRTASIVMTFDSADHPLIVEGQNQGGLYVLALGCNVP